MMTALTALLILAAPGDETRVYVDAIRETQVTITVDQGNRRTQLQATVIWRDGDAVTLLTAAHGIAPGDVGAQVRLRRGDKWVSGRVERVAQNPFYRPAGSGDIPGADNAFTRIRLDDGGTLDPAAFKNAELTGWATPENEGNAVTVLSIDQFGKHHLVRGGNYSNPRWLEWGPIYRPIPGDSGSGVFVIRKKPDGSVAPVLIGAVVDRSDQGGGASLIHASDGWIRELFAPPAAASPAAGSSARPKS